jgi:hypothetical protein
VPDLSPDGLTEPSERDTEPMNLKVALVMKECLLCAQPSKFIQLKVTTKSDTVESLDDALGEGGGLR